MKPVENQLEIAEAMYRYDKPAEHRVKRMEDITDADIQRYYELGYIAVEEVLTEEEVASAIQDINDVIEQRIVGPKVQYMKESSQIRPEERESMVRKLWNFVDFTPNLHHICHHPKILGLLERIFAEKPRFIVDQALLKPPSPEAGMEKPWHQDMAYANFSFTKMVAGVWVALDEAALDNGCMHVIPSSHREGPVPHYAVRDWQLCDLSVHVERDEVVPLKPGGLLVFAGLLHHGTPPNRSNKRRRALQFHYTPESAKKMTPEEYKFIFTNEMTKAEC